MLLQAGEWYLNRNGRVVGPLEETGDTEYPFRNLKVTYRQDGVWIYGQVNGRDLVEHLPRTDPRHPEYVPEQSHPIPGQWYFDTRLNLSAFCCGRDNEGRVIFRDESGLYGIEENEQREYRHAPNCTGFDWRPELEQSVEPELKLWISVAGVLRLSVNQPFEADREPTAAELLALKHLIVLAPEAD